MEDLLPQGAKMRRNVWFAIGDTIQVIERGLIQVRLYVWRKGVAAHTNKQLEKAL